MSARLVQRIQTAIVQGEYDVTVHAVEEMAEDGLDIFDVEAAIVSGQVTQTEMDDPRGACYTIVGTVVDEHTRVGVRRSFPGDRSLFDYHGLCRDRLKGENNVRIQMRIL